jgi:anti-sigma factor RsiW
MKHIDRHILMAYVDGELDHEAAANVEACLDRDHEARALVAMFRETAGAVRSAILPYGHAPVPPYLVDSIRSKAPPSAHRGAAVRPRWIGPVAAIAASLVLLVLAGGGGFLAADYRFAELETARSLERQAEQNHRDEAVQSALNTLVSGKALVWSSDAGASGRIVPIRTFKNRSGQYCREYRDETRDGNGTMVRYGVACRGADKVWRHRYTLIPSQQSDNSNSKARAF